MDIPQRRRQAVRDLYHGGYAVPLLSAIFGVDPATIYRWIKADQAGADRVRGEAAGFRAALAADRGHGTPGPATAQAAGHAKTEILMNNPPAPPRSSPLATLLDLYQADKAAAADVKARQEALAASQDTRAKSRAAVVQAVADRPAAVLVPGDAVVVLKAGGASGDDYTEESYPLNPNIPDPPPEAPAA